MNQQCERGEEMLSRNRTLTGVYRTSCTVLRGYDATMLRCYDATMLRCYYAYRTNTDKVTRIFFQQSLRGKGMTCKEMRENNQQSLRGHGQTCKEMRKYPTELEGSAPNLQRDEGEQPKELEGFRRDLQRDEDVRECLSRWKAAISRDLQQQRDFVPASPLQLSTHATLLLIEGGGEEEGAKHAPDQGDHCHLVQLHLEEGVEGEKEPRRSRNMTTFGRPVSVPRQCAPRHHL